MSVSFGEVEMSGTKVLGLAAICTSLALAAPVMPAQALSLINPGAAAAVQQDSKPLTTEVRWHHHWHHRHWRRWHRWHGWHHRHWHRWHRHYW
jgi:hypothetical protein